MEKRTRKRRSIRLYKRRFLIYFSALLLLMFFLTAGRFLTLSQPLQHADVIIVLSGGSGRMEKATELYKDGYTPYMMLSNAEESISTSGDMLQTAMALGIPQDAILLEDAAQSTYQNAEYTLPILTERGFNSAIVVSSDFHMRRVKFIFEHVYKKSGIELTYVSSDSGYHAKQWWGDRYSRETTFNEYTKMIGNAFGYNGPEAKSSLNEIKGWFPVN